jgi:hypothetical protein
VHGLALSTLNRQAVCKPAIYWIGTKLKDLRSCITPKTYIPWEPDNRFSASQQHRESSCIKDAMVTGWSKPPRVTLFQAWVYPHRLVLL